ncbi:universal stress protein [Syntrophorhabdus aromaticivorans]|uniref:universal stress protein n=1 Tax=Syntrophorhabdus aromaticivorans TaxID=328301 RepID=UPI000417613E|nr:universal stress protein [Syntrophorhabdus aromaticivorans]HBA54454.1 universal stress protein [Syntrophorhabdus aromaticivorans]
MLRPTKILVPTDFSEYSDKALKQGLDIAKQYNAKVFLLHVIPRDIQRCAIDYCLSEDQVRGIEEQMVTRAKTDMQQQLDKFPRSKEVEVVTDIKRGIPYEAILEEEAANGIDLIVIASLGRTGIARLIVGSVARNVLKGAKCPVLLTK